MSQNVILNIDCGVVRPSFKGDWDASTAYKNMDLVSYNNTVYQCVRDNVAVGVAPESEDGEPNQGWVAYLVSVPGSAGSKGDKGPKGDTGPSGEPGVTYHPSVSPTGVLSWSASGEEPQPVNIVDMVVSRITNADEGVY